MKMTKTKLSARINFKTEIVSVTDLVPVSRVPEKEHISQILSFNVLATNSYKRKEEPHV